MEGPERLCRSILPPAVRPHKSEQTFLDHPGRKPVEIRLKRIRSENAVGINEGFSFVTRQVVFEKGPDQRSKIGIPEMEEVSGIIKLKSVLLDRLTQSPNPGAPLIDHELQAAALGMISGAKSGQPGSDDDHLLHFSL
jgi:hypothetical protein